jgi:hypothetical protein
MKTEREKERERKREKQIKIVTYVVNFRVQSVFAGVLQHDFAGGFGVGPSAVLVGPLDGQNAPLVVVHTLVLCKLDLGSGAGVHVVELGLAHLILHVGSANRARTGIPALNNTHTASAFVSLLLSVHSS